MTDHAQITWQIMNWSHSYHEMFTWLIMHWSRGWSCSDHLGFECFTSNVYFHWTLAYNLIFMKFELFISGRVATGCGFHAYIENHLTGPSQPTWNDSDCPRVIFRRAAPLQLLCLLPDQGLTISLQDSQPCVCGRGGGVLGVCCNWGVTFPSCCRVFITMKHINMLNFSYF